MADIYRGYTMNEVGEAADWSSRERDLLKDIIDKLPEQADTLVQTEHYHNRLTSLDQDPDPAVWVDASGNVKIGSNPVVDSKLHVQVTPAGAVAAGAGSVITMEDDDDTLLTALIPDANLAGIMVESPSHANDGRLTYDMSTRTWMFRGDATDDMLQIICAGTHGIVPRDNVPIRAGGANGLLLHNDSGDGCKVNDDGDLQMDSGEYVRLGHTVSADTSGTARNVYGPSNLESYLPIKDSSGAVWWCPCTSTEPT